MKFYHFLYLCLAKCINNNVVMRKLLYIFSAFFLFSCVEKNPSEVASTTAKLYYDHLLEGRYEEYIDGFYRLDSIPSTYRTLLVENAQMFIHQQKQERKGLREVTVLRAQADTALHVAHVFLLFSYGDDSKEEVLVPMVERKGVWYMR